MSVCSIFCIPANALSLVEEVRSGEVQIDSKDLLVDKQLSYAGLTSYDSRKYYNTYVFNQEHTGTCWANAGLMTLTLANDSNNQGRYIFSRRHATLSITGNVMTGGQATTLASYITSGKGPVLEIEMPWKSMVTDEEIKNNVRADEKEKELLKTLKPTIKLESYEKLPCIYKELDENGNLIYYQIIRKSSSEIKKYESEINKIKNELKNLEERYKQYQEDFTTALNQQDDIMNKYNQLIINRWYSKRNRSNDVGVQ